MTLKEILFMYIALIIWIAKIIMFLSIVLIPIAILLIDKYQWWKEPFDTAYYKS